MTTNTDIRTYAAEAETCVGSWAIFLLDPLTNKHCRFACIYPTKEKAAEQARTLAIDAIRKGSTEFVFNVIQIIHEIGMKDGVMIDRGS